MSGHYWERERNLHKGQIMPYLSFMIGGITLTSRFRAYTNTSYRLLEEYRCNTFLVFVEPCWNPFWTIPKVPLY